MGDARAMFEWMNDPDCRAASFTGRTVTYKEHLAWMKKAVAHPDFQIFIGIIRRMAIGNVRLDFLSGEVSIALAKQFRGQSLAVPFLKKVLWLYGSPRYMAHIKDGNLASLRTFEKAGFTRTHPRERLVDYNGNLCHEFELTARS